jgi:hypothetical protein
MTFEKCDVCGTVSVSLAQHKRRAHDIDPTARERSCAYCGDEFEQTHCQQQYCSTSCANRARQRGDES